MTTAATPRRATATAPAVGAIALTVLLWASAFPGIRAGLAGFDPGALAALRYALASLAFLLLAASGRIARPELRDLPRMGLAGGLGIAAYNLALNTGERSVDPGTASFLINTSPIFTALLGALLLGERFSPWAWIGAVTGFTGAAMIAFAASGGFRFSPDAAVVLGAAVCQAAQFVLQKPLLPRYGALATTAYLVWAGTIFLLPFLPGGIAALPLATPSAILAVLYLGLFPAAVAYAAWSYALAHFPVGRTTMSLYLVPPIATLLTIAWFGIWPTPVALFGGAVAIAGVIVVNTLGRRARIA
jgi:drug/metabolite transporter (DMT)-like permease